MNIKICLLFLILVSVAKIDAMNNDASNSLIHSNQLITEQQRRDHALMQFVQLKGIDDDSLKNEFVALKLKVYELEVQNKKDAERIKVYQQTKKEDKEKEQSTCDEKKYHGDMRKAAFVSAGITLTLVGLLSWLFAPSQTPAAIVAPVSVPAPTVAFPSAPASLASSSSSIPQLASSSKMRSHFHS